MRAQFRGERAAKRIREGPTRRDGNLQRCSVPCLARGFSYRTSGPRPERTEPGDNAPAGGKGGEFDLNRTEKEQVIGELHEKMATAKGVYVKNVTVSTTMGPGIKLDLAELAAHHE